MRPVQQCHDVAPLSASRQADRYDHGILEHELALTSTAQTAWSPKTMPKREAEQVNFARTAGRRALPANFVRSHLSVTMEHAAGSVCRECPTVGNLNSTRTEGTARDEGTNEGELEDGLHDVHWPISPPNLCAAYLPTESFQRNSTRDTRGASCTRVSTKAAFIVGVVSAVAPPACPGCRRPTVRTPSPPRRPRHPGKLDRPSLVAWALAEKCAPLACFQHTYVVTHVTRRTASLLSDPVPTTSCVDHDAGPVAPA